MQALPRKYSLWVQFEGVVNTETLDAIGFRMPGVKRFKNKTLFMKVGKHKRHE